MSIATEAKNARSEVVDGKALAVVEPGVVEWGMEDNVKPYEKKKASATLNVPVLGKGDTDRFFPNLCR